MQQAHNLTILGSNPRWPTKASCKRGNMCHHTKVYILERVTLQSTYVVSVFDDLSKVMEIAKEISIENYWGEYYIYEAILNDTSMQATAIYSYSDGKMRTDFY